MSYVSLGRRTSIIPCDICWILANAHAHETSIIFEIKGART